jgi:hypothetical protein
MSDYVRVKAIRIPLEFTGIKYDDRDELEFGETTKDKWGYMDEGKFMFAPTEGDYIDYCLEHEHDGYGEFGKVRELYPNEVEAWTPIFKDAMPECDMSKARLVEYCWYNCCEAPDYYGTDGESDPFFKEVLPR